MSKHHRLNRVLTDLERAIAWVQDGIAETLPTGIRRRLTGTPPTESTFDADHTPPDRSAPQRLCLDGSLIFWTSLSLPSQAKSTRVDAVRLRLGELSPLPSDQVAYAVGRPSPESETRVSVPVVITQKNTLDTAKAALGSLGGEVIARREDGLVLTLHSSRDPISVWRKRISSIGFGFSIIVICSFMATQLYAARLVQHHRSHQPNHIAELRALNDRNAELENLLSTSPSVTVRELTGILSALEIPDGTALESVQFENGSVHIRGFVPATTDISRLRSAGATTTQNENRDGWLTFSWTGSTSNDG